MKTAQEWLKVAEDSRNWVAATRFGISFVEQIQHDAWKQGMTDAAALATDAVWDQKFALNIVFKRDGTKSV